MVTGTDFLRLKAEINQPLVAEIAPVREPLEVGARFTEKFQFHLLEFTCPECKIARGNLVAERFADLADAERDLAPGGALDILEIDKNALGGFWTQVELGAGVFGNALEGLEHQVELAYIGEIPGATHRAGNFLFPDIGNQLIITPAIDGQVDAIGMVVVFDQLVGAVTALALLAVDQGIGKAADVAGSDPGLGVHQDGAVDPDIMGIFLDKFLPPGRLDVVFQQDTQRAVVPGIGQTAIDLRTWEDKATILSQGNDFLHGFFCRKHDALVLHFRQVVSCLRLGCLCFLLGFNVFFYFIDYDCCITFIKFFFRTADDLVQLLADGLG